MIVSGPGPEGRNSIGIILVAGMIVGTVFTLFVVPVFYPLISAAHAHIPEKHRADQVRDAELVPRVFARNEEARPRSPTRGQRDSPGENETPQGTTAWSRKSGNRLTARPSRGAG